MNKTNIIEAISSADCDFFYLDEKRLLLRCNQEPKLDLEDLVGIKEIRIIETPLTKTEFLPIDNLEILDLHNTRIRTIPEGGKNLRYLDISLTPIKTLSWIDNMEHLEFLNLSSLNISNIDKLATLSSLEGLDLSFCYQIKDISPLKNLENLRWVNLSYANIRDITPLILNKKEYNKLEIVDLTGTFAPPDQIKELAKLGTRIIIRHKDYGPKI